jgi:hypothetical protein
LDEVCIKAFAEDELAYYIAWLRDELFIGGVVVAVKDDFDGAGIALVYDTDGVCVRERGLTKAGVGDKFKVVTCGGLDVYASVDADFPYEVIFTATAVCYVYGEGADIVPGIGVMCAGGCGGAGV